MMKTQSKKFTNFEKLNNNELIVFRWCFKSTKFFWRL